MLSDAFSFCYAECHYAECRYAKCRGAVGTAPFQVSAPSSEFSIRQPRMLIQGWYSQHMFYYLR